MHSSRPIQAQYYKTSGRWLPMKLKTRSLVMAILIPVLSVTSVTLTHVTMVDFHLSQVSGTGVR